ncbi:hypothetical protein C8F01DRAFT_1264069 [Mycena amicta]|nr:hypothetical protein C8F01DRAFT_1264069 [Mycena amicta]
MLVALRLRGPNVPAYYDALEEFLFNVIKPKLWKFARLFIFAPQNAWPVIISAMDGEDFPWLDMLVLRSDAVKTVYKLYNEKHERLWALPDDFPMPEVDDLPGIPVLDLVFPLPSGHHLKLANLQGVSLGNILVNNGELSKWIFSTQHLVLAGMYVPAVGVGLDLPFEIGWDTSGDWDQPDDWDIERGFSFLPRREDPFMEIEEEIEEEEEEAHAPKCTMECLELVQLEHDCTPFFRELVEYTTDSLEALCIRGWNPDSRIWNDFIKIFGPQTTMTALNTADEYSD